MRAITRIILVAVFGLCAGPSAMIHAGSPAVLKRADSFLGIHFDFHAGRDCDQVGKNVTPEMVGYIIDQVQPDYIQCDCKGHPGLSSYPTKVGYPAPGFVLDPLRIWRDVTASRGVALYVHYSGVLDAEAVRQHPEWAVVGADGERGGSGQRVTSVYGPYVDRLLIPQIKELIDIYGIDGAWIDGECWGTERDWSPGVLRRFTGETGISSIPREPDDPNWDAFSDFCRDGFRNYLDHYVTVLHEHEPDFQIASNWAYSSMMPEKPAVKVDFISGDYSPLNSVNSARLEGRVMAQQGLPWDLMAWSFVRDWNASGSHSTKTVAQLKQEAAGVLALGGGFQAYFKQKRDGSIYRWPIPLMKEVAAFCRQRQSLCHRARSVPQIGLVLSTRAYYKRLQKLFSAWHGEMDAFNGILQSLLDSQHVVDIVMEHHLEDDIGRYPLLVWPEWDTIETEFKDRLVDYVREGGRLLVLGARACALFETELGIELDGEPETRVNGLEHNHWIANIRSARQRIRLLNETVPLGRVFEQWNMDGPWEPAGSLRRLGRGRIASVCLDLGDKYLNAATTVSRDFLSAVVDTLFPDPVVRVAGSRHVDVTLMRKKGDLMVNLINTAGPHADPTVHVFDDIPVAGPLRISLRLDRRPSSITLEPGSRPCEYTYANGTAALTVPRLELHEILVIQHRKK